MSAQVDFYILAQPEPEAKYRYACRIANKAYERGLKVYMHTDQPAQSRAIDKMLWTFSQESFVPHAVCDGDGGDDADVERYPVQIGCVDAPEGCVDILISLRQDAPSAEEYARFGRVAELIIDQKEDKGAGRRRFRFYREQGVEPRTHNISQ